MRDYIFIFLNNNFYCLKTIDFFVFGGKVSLLHIHVAFISVLSPRTQTFCVSVSTHSPMPAWVFAQTRDMSEFFIRETSGVVLGRNARNGGRRFEKRRDPGRTTERSVKIRAVRRPPGEDRPFSRSARGSGLTQSGSVSS